MQQRTGIYGDSCPQYCCVLGHTDASRKLFLVFTIRKRRIRIISARDMSTKERRQYHEQVKAEADVQD
ncbi:MAG: BrnT family toxin [Nitrospirota bacterium]